MKYEKEFSAIFVKQALFTSGDATRVLARLGATESYTLLFLHNLVEKNKVVRLKKGVYTYNKSESLVGFAFRPFYYGMEYALTIRGIWTQQANPVIITPTKANPGTREILGINAVVRRISKSQFFGFEYINYGGFFVPVSESEKILLDLVYFQEKIDPETMVALIRACDKGKLQMYERKIGKSYRTRLENMMKRYDVSINQKITHESRSRAYIVRLKK